MMTLPSLTDSTLRQPQQVLSIRLAPLPADMSWPLLDAWLHAWLESPLVEPARPDTPHDPVEAQLQRLAWRIAVATPALLRGCGIPLLADGKVLAMVPPQDAAAPWQCDIAFAQLDGVAATLLLQACDCCVRWLQAVAWQAAGSDPLSAFFQSLAQDILPRLLPHAIAAPSSMALLQAAANLGIPWRHEGNGVFQLGWGVHLRHSFTSRLDRDSSIGIRAAGNKQLAAQWLRQAGLPTAVQRLVGNGEQASAAAQELGWPLVVKPLARDRGEGVSTGIGNHSQLQLALDKAAHYGWPLLLEQQAPGVCHRILVVGGRVMYVVKRLPVAVQGDGVRSIQALIDAANSQQLALPPWRRAPPLRADDDTRACLREAGLQLASVPAAGAWIALRAIESSADGGRDEDMLAAAHPGNLALALRAAALFGLEVAGIDMITPDIGQPWHVNGAIINEVNAAPALGASQSSRDAMPLLMQQLFPTGGRIPVELFVGGAMAEAAARQRRDELQRAGVACYFTTAQHSEDTTGQRHPLACSSLYQRCLVLLNDRSVGALTIAITPAQWRQEELPLDRVARVQQCGDAEHE